MLSRRLLRIKILQCLYAHHKALNHSLDISEKQLFFSIKKSYDLYHYLLLLLTVIVDYAASRIDLARNKKIPSTEDLNPNTRFIGNRVVAQLNDNQHLRSYLKETRLSWANYPDLIRKLYKEISGSEAYKQYMEDENPSYEADKKFILYICSHHFTSSEELYHCIEEQSIYWNDDLDFIISMIIKTVKKFRENSGNETPLMPLYRKDNDRDFVKRLFRKAILQGDEYRKLIERYTTNWEIDRIAFMDILIMQLATAEIIEFHDIPTKVSFNEYLEIAKFYSTPKSSNFINGILDRIIHQLKKDKVIVKKGRGLVGEDS